MAGSTEPGRLDLQRQALADMLAGEAQAAGATGRHHPATADAVICLFQHGGPSQMDLFDPKPELTKRHGQPYAGDLEVHFDGQKGNCLASPFEFRPHGQSGLVLSELLPHTGSIADEITLVRSEGEPGGPTPMKITSEKLELDSGDALLAQDRAFAESVATRAEPEVSGEDGYRALDLALRIQESIEPMVPA